MEFDGNTRKFNGNPVEIRWKSLESYGNPWNPVEINGILWKFMEFNRNPWKLNGNIGNPVGIYGIRWKSLEASGNL